QIGRYAEPYEPDCRTTPARARPRGRMKVLVVGSGGREHALCQALSRDPHVGTLVCAPGNAGTAAIAEPRPLDIGDPGAVADLAEAVRADLTVIGPEAGLVTGAADDLRARGLRCFGPSAA